MDLLREYWWLVLIVVALVATAFALLRPHQRVQLTDTAPMRPHMQDKSPAPGRGLAGEAAAAASDMTGDILQAPVHRALDGELGPEDDFTRLKGVGPKLADTLRGMGFRSFSQLAQLSPTELERIDDQLGAFRGRLSRDRVVEQAGYLARNDIDGFEQRFGKL